MQAFPFAGLARPWAQHWAARWRARDAASRLGTPAALSSALCRACAWGSLGSAQYLWGRLGEGQADMAPHSRAAFSAACAHGRLGVARWLWGLRGSASCPEGGPAAAGSAGSAVAASALTLADVRARDNAALRVACAGGHRAAARWLWGLGLTLADVRARGCEAFRAACAGGHLATAQWLWGLRDASRSSGSSGAGAEVAGLTLADVRASEAFLHACKNGHMAVVHWLWGLRDASASGEAGAAAKEGLTVADVAAGCCEGFYVACVDGRLADAQWFWELGVGQAPAASYPLSPWAYMAFRVACRGGHLAVARWLWNAHDEPGRLVLSGEPPIAAPFEVRAWLASLPREPARLCPVEGRPGNCPICLGPSFFSEGEESAAGAAGAAVAPEGHDPRHWACRGCLTAWLAEHNTCPVCRAVVR